MILAQADDKGRVDYTYKHFCELNALPFDGEHLYYRVQWLDWMRSCYLAQMERVNHLIHEEMRTYEPPF